MNHRQERQGDAWLVVANESDRNIAALRANGVSGVFSVDNNLKVESRS